MKAGFMLIAVLLVAGATAYVLVWFFRRLRRIEEDRWGDKRTPPKLEQRG